MCRCDSYLWWPNEIQQIIVFSFVWIINCGLPSMKTLRYFHIRAHWSTKFGIINTMLLIHTIEILWSIFNGRNVMDGRKSYIYTYSHNLYCHNFINSFLKSVKCHRMLTECGSDDKFSFFWTKRYSNGCFKYVYRLQNLKGHH